MRLITIVFFIFCFQLVAPIFTALDVGHAMWGDQQYNFTTHGLETATETNSTYYNLTLDDPKDYTGNFTTANIKIGGFGLFEFANVLWQFVTVVIGTLSMIYTIIIQLFGTSYVVTLIASALQSVVDLVGAWGILQLLLGRGEKILG